MKYYTSECELRKDECKLGQRIAISMYPCKGPDTSSVSCTASAMQLNLRRTLLGRSTRKRLVLNDPQCRVSLNRTHIVAATLLNRCGTKIRYTLSSIIYSNTLRTLPPRRNALISRGKPVNITFECEYLLKRRTENRVRYTHGRLPLHKSLIEGRKTKSLKNGMFVEIDATRNYTIILTTLRYRGPNIKLIPYNCYAAPSQGGLKGAKLPIIENG